MRILKYIIYVLIALFILISPEIQAEDRGVPDTLILVPSELDVSGNDSLFTVEVWIFNDSNEVAAQLAFNWVSDLITLDSVVPSLEARSRFQIFVLFDTDIGTSNVNNRAVFAGISFTGTGMLQRPNRHLMATYYFSVRDWSVDNEIWIDTSQWSEHHEMFIYEAPYHSNLTYTPVWQAGEKLIIIRDASFNGCCGQYTGGLTGNINCDHDGRRNLADIDNLIDHVYISRSPICCPSNGNIDGDRMSSRNLADITRLIDHVYIRKNETAGCE